MNKISLLLIGLLLSGACFALELTVPAIFADQMVLQRGQNVPVWGDVGSYN